MKCKNCGEELADDALFCIYCGSRQEDKKTSPEPASEPKIEEKKTEGVNSALINKDAEIEPIEPLDGISSFVSETVEIENPYDTELDVQEEEKKAEQEDAVQKAKQMLNEICLDTRMEEILYPIVSPYVRGFRCIITGNNGTKKAPSIQRIGEILYVMGKTKTKEIEYLPFGEIPKEFTCDKLYVIRDLASAIERLFNLEDLSDESNHMQQEYKKHMERLLKAPNSAYIILDGYDTQIKGFLSLDARISFIFSQIIYFPDLSNEEIYNIFYEALPEFHKKQLPVVFKHDFIGYLERNKRFFPFNNDELGKYLAQTSSKQPELKLPPEKYNATSLKDSFSTIIGMNDVKEQVYELSQFLSARKALEEAGAKLPHFHLHMMFLGNPGVGKTTIARIIAKVLFDLGYIREDKLIEVTSKDLVGNGNQTGIKTNKAILSALGGVLFVDEAYSLSNSCGQAGAESIATLIKAMEDYKKDLVVMFAGYTLEMNDFVRSNSGIASRIAYTFQFKDYSTKELYDIFDLKTRLSHMFIQPQAEEAIMKIIEWGRNRKNFGNGRYIDKLFQRTLTKHAALNLPPKDILTIRKESVPTVEEIMKTFGRFLG